MTRAIGRQHGCKDENDLHFLAFSIVRVFAGFRYIYSGISIDIQLKVHSRDTFCLTPLRQVAQTDLIGWP